MSFSANVLISGGKWLEIALAVLVLLLDSFDRDGCEPLDSVASVGFVPFNMAVGGCVFDGAAVEATNLN